MTTQYLAKGRIPTGESRLTTFLQGYQRPFLSVEDITLYSLEKDQKIIASRGHIRREDLVLAHEFVDIGGDHFQKALADNTGSDSVVASVVLRQPSGWEILGKVKPEFLEQPQSDGFSVMMQPEFRGIEDRGVREFESLKGLPYLILNRAHVHCLFRYE